MSFSQTVTQGWSGNGRGYTASKAYSADGSESRDVSVPDSSTDLEVVIGIDYDEVVNLFLYSDQDVTIETNSGSVPDDTISLKAGVPLNWNADSYFDNPLSADVTSLFITNASGAAATVRIEVLQDSTP